MGLIGVNNCSGGITTVDRVQPGSKALLERADGFDIADGTLAPSGTIQKVNTGSALSGTTPEQVPFAFDMDGVVRIIARDSTEALREHLNGVWSAAGTVVDILPESTPARFREQLIIPTGGYHPRIMAYEPGSTGTKTRPLSIMSPSDYKASAKPTVTASTDLRVRLFDCEGAAVGETAWTAASGWGVDNSGTDVTIFTIDDTPATATAGTAVATKAISNAGVEAQGKEWLIVDIMLADDPQVYNYGGLFVNDPNMQASGYELKIYSDTGCSVLLNSWYIPKISPEGKVNRMAFKMPTYTVSQVVKGIAIYTSSFWTHPTVNTSISVYSEELATDTNADWNLKGNWLVPGIAYNISPLVKMFESVQQAGVRQYATPPPTNLITNPGFEGGTNWNLVNNASTIGNGDWDMPGQGAHGGTKALKLDFGSVTVPEYAEWTAGINVTGGAEYKFEAWNYCPWNPALGETAEYKWHIDITFDAGDPARFPSSGEYTPGQQGWKEYTGQFTTPSTATSITSFKITCASEAGYMRDMMFDDIAVYKLDQTADDSVYVIQKFTSAMTEWNPEKPRIRYRYAFLGRDLLGKDDYRLMISNPSIWDSESNCTYADPFRTYTLAITLPGGRSGIESVASAPTAGGTGYTQGDVLTVDDGTGGTVTASTVAAGVVTAVTLTTAGSGYTEGAGATTTGGTGTGCTVNITTNNAIDLYGSYLTHVLIYRQIYDGATQTWSAGPDESGEDKLIAVVPITGSISQVDAGNDTLPQLGDFELPKEAELTNDYASSARYVMVADGRVYAACLDWPGTNNVAKVVTFGTNLVTSTAHGYVDGTKLRFSGGTLPTGVTAGVPYFVINATANTFALATGKGGTAMSITDNDAGTITATPAGWASRLDIEVSGWDKPWVFPTTNDENSSPADGTLLRVPAVTGSEIRGLVSRNDEKYVWLDNEFFLLQGDNPVSGYRFVRIAPIGLVSNRSLAASRRGLIWHDGNDFYYYSGGQPEVISRFKIDSTLIDWTLAHNAVVRGSEYILYCKYYDTVTTTWQYSLLIFDMDTGSWRIRRSGTGETSGLKLVGICTDGQDVWGVTTAGDAVNLFSGVDGQTEYGSGESSGAQRDVWTQYLQLCAPDYDVQINHAVVEAVLGYAAGTATFNATTDKVTVTAHGYCTGLVVRFSLDSTGVIPGGLAVDTDYYVIKIDANTFYVATSYANAVASTYINITNAGTATITCTPRASLSLVFNAQGKLDGTATRTLGVTAAQTRYPDIGLNLQGNAVQIRATYEGVTPATILSMGVIADTVPIA